MWTMPLWMKPIWESLGCGVSISDAEKQFRRWIHPAMKSQSIKIHFTLHEILICSRIDSYIELHAKNLLITPDMLVVDRAKVDAEIKRLIESYGYDEVRVVVKWLEKVRDDKYAPDTTDDEAHDSTPEPKEG